MTIGKQVAALVLGLGLAGSPALAHDVTLWPQQEDKSVKLKMHYGDPGDYQPFDKVRFVELAVFDSKGIKINFLRYIERGADNKILITPALRLGDWPGGTYMVESRY